MWTSDYEIENLLQMVSSNWEEIRPLYLELHAYVRKKLNECYGKLAPTGGKPIPVHLTAFHEAVAWAIELFIHSNNHLEIINLVNSPAKDNDINYLLMLALEKIPSILHSYVVDLWRYKIFQGVVKEEEYNKKWWELRYRLKYSLI
ncbi:hypothetical protein AAG570_001043 [Ranatra chinensis]|uniref:Angiotensin-converting enzyme n=1 Tax=Ranatra chinensis TaxID=642074 RepID=A0ABD0YCK5_9HEMI